MSDEEFQKAVLAELHSIRLEMSDQFNVVEGRFDKIDRRMDAIAARMDDVENRIEDVASRLSLLQSTVNQVVAGTTRALDAVATLGKRVTRLENPDE